MTEYYDGEIKALLDRIGELEERLGKRSKGPKTPSKRQLLTIVCDEIDVIRSTNELVYAYSDYCLYPTMLLSDDGEELIRNVGRNKLQLELVSSEVTEITKALQSKATRSPRILIEPRVIYDSTKNIMYHDLCNSDGTCVHIDPSGPRVDSLIMNPLFHRTLTTQTLPEPDFNGTFSDLETCFDFIESDNVRHLIIAYIVQMFSPAQERVPLYIYGDSQSGKSAVCKMISFLVDPRTIKFANSEFSFTKRIRDMMAAALDQYAIVFGNEDELGSELANELCKRATGGATIECRLYRQGVSFQIEAIRSVIINALHPPAVRPDLLKRFLVVELQKISQERRLDPSEAEAKFMALRPRLLGALYKAISTGLRRWDSVARYREMERHSEFCRWITAISPEWGWEDDYFPTVLSKHKDHTLDSAASILSLTEALKAVLQNRCKIDIQRHAEPTPHNQPLEATYGEMVGYIELFAPWYKSGGRLSYNMLRNDLTDYQEQLSRGGVAFIKNVRVLNGSPISLYRLIDE